MLWIEESLNGLEELIIEGYFKCPINEEKKFVNKLYEGYFKYAEDFNLKKPKTIIELSKCIKNLREKFEMFAIKETDPKCYIDKIIAMPVGSLGRKIAQIITEFCETNQTKSNGYWYLKVCFDEAEVLESPQRIVMNSVVRLSTSYLFFIVSYVSNIEEMVSTALPNLTLANADRKIIDLDNISDSQFNNFAEGVATVRINATLQDQGHKTIEDEFRISELLGRLNINNLIHMVLSKTENKNASQYWIEGAKKYKKTSFFKQVNKDENNGSLPFYQNYIIEKLNIRLPSPKDEKWKRRKQDSAEIRKRMVSAYLCLCNDFNTEPIYAYDVMLMQLCDRCIRDFLRQLHHIYIVNNKKIDNFIAIKNMNIDKQNLAVKQASLEKKDFIKRSALKSPVQIERLIDGLSKATSSMHSKNGIYSLRTHERGRFVLDINTLFTKDKEAILELIKQAAEAGYLRISKAYGRKWKFQVHASLAPAYGFSYRGSHNEVTIGYNDLYELANSYDDDHHKQIVESILSRISPNDPEAQSEQKRFW